MARVGVAKMESYIRGVTTLHHYKRISSRDLGLKELRIFGTEVVLAFPGGFIMSGIDDNILRSVSIEFPWQHNQVEPCA